MQAYLDAHPELFWIAQKKPIAFVPTAHLDGPPRRKTYYVHEDAKPVRVTTTLAGKKETHNVAHRGDIVLTGVQGERYVLRPRAFLRLYDVRDEVAVPRPIQRSVTRVTRSLLDRFGDPMSFVAPWNEPMMAEHGDYLAKDPTAPQGGYYRIEKKAFRQTYNRITTATKT